MGLALLAMALNGRPARAGFDYGFLFGVAYLLPLLSWLYEFFGAGFGVWPWLGLVVLELLYFALPRTVRPFPVGAYCVLPAGGRIPGPCRILRSVTGELRGRAHRVWSCGPACCIFVGARVGGSLLSR